MLQPFLLPSSASIAASKAALPSLPPSPGHTQSSLGPKRFDSSLPPFQGQTPSEDDRRNHSREKKFPVVSCTFGKKISGKSRKNGKIASIAWRGRRRVEMWGDYFFPPSLPREKRVRKGNDEIPPFPLSSATANLNGFPPPPPFPPPCVC